MVFQAFWLSIALFQHISYHPSLVELLYLCLQLTFLPQQPLYLDDPRSISPSVLCLTSVFLIFSPPQISIWIISRAMLQGLGPGLLTSHSWLNTFHDVVMQIALSICCISPLELVNGSFSGNWLLYFVLTLLLGEILDVAWCGPHGCKLHLLCQGWYVWLTWTKQNLGFDRHYFGNSNANCTTWLHCSFRFM